MKKIILICILSLSILVGCSNSDITKEQQKIYEGFKESLLNNGELISSSIPFAYKMNIKNKNGKALYSISVDKPLVVMNSVQMLILNPQDSNVDFVSNSIGIFDEKTINMVPNQKNDKNGYVDTIKLKGSSKETSFKVLAMVSWKDSNQLTQTQVFFSFNVVDGVIVKEGNY